MHIINRRVYPSEEKEINRWVYPSEEKTINRRVFSWEAKLEDIEEVAKLNYHGH